MCPRLSAPAGLHRLGAAARLLAAAALLQLPLPARAQSGGEIASISSQVSAAYSRVRLPDGTFRPETYTFGEGGRLTGPSNDETIDKLTFLDVAKVVSGPLEKKNYLPVGDRNPEKTKLLIMIYWGTTAGTADGSDSLAYQNLQRTQGSKPPPTPQPASGGSAGGGGPVANQQERQNAAAQNARQAGEDGAMAAVAAENWQRDQLDMKNAMLLGYDAALAETSVGSTALSRRHDDLVTEIEEPRYFVVLMAYDYQALWTRKKHSLLWVTRFSIRERGADFERMLPPMVDYASQYFGMDSHGLLRRPLPEGHVEIGVPRSLGPLPDK